MSTVITVTMAKKCAECGKGGATGNGLCLSCSAKSLKKGAKMKSATGRAVQARIADLLKR